MNLVLKGVLKQQIVAQLEAAFPDEAGGFLLGARAGDTTTVEAVVSIDNIFPEHERYHRYEMTPQDWMRLEDEADERGLTLVGYYHSHPNSPAIPSEYDRVHALPNFAYLITSIMPDGAAEMLAWHLRDDRTAFESDTLTLKED